MDFLTPAITGGIVGGIIGASVAAIYVFWLNKKMREKPCPRCGQKLGDKKLGARSITQILWGGWTCPQCGCDVDRHGKVRSG